MLEAALQLSLSDLSAGDLATIVDFQGGRITNNRLVSLGFTPGSTHRYGSKFRARAIDRQCPGNPDCIRTRRSCKNYRYVWSQ